MFIKNIILRVILKEANECKTKIGKFSLIGVTTIFLVIPFVLACLLRIVKSFISAIRYNYRIRGYALGSIFLAIGIVLSLNALSQDKEQASCDETEIAIVKTREKSDLDKYIEKTTSNGQIKSRFIELQKKGLEGVDISGYQIESYRQDIAFAKDFVIMRAGINDEKDRIIDVAVKEALQKEKLLGFYFAVLDDEVMNNYTPKAHAEWAYNIIKDYIGWGIIALDIEREDLSDDVDEVWATEWLHNFQDISGVCPVLYTGKKYILANDWTDASANFPLWVAWYHKYGAQIYLKEYDHPEVILPYWDQFTIHQYESSYTAEEIGHALDKDYFLGSAKDWWALSK